MIGPVVCPVCKSSPTEEEELDGLVKTLRRWDLTDDDIMFAMESGFRRRYSAILAKARAAYAAQPGPSVGEAE